MSKPPAIIDTNVVVSGLITGVSASPTARILDGMLGGRFRFFLSVELLAEYREVFSRPKIRRRHRLSQSEIDVLLTEIAAAGNFLDLEAPMADRPRGDDHLRRILSAAPAALLVTGDRRLAAQLERDFRVLTARAFADLLDD